MHNGFLINSLEQEKKKKKIRKVPIVFVKNKTAKSLILWNRKKDSKEEEQVPDSEIPLKFNLQLNTSTN